MKLRALKMVSFKNATLATLQQAVNDYTAGLAVASGVSGTVSYAAGDVGEKELVYQDFFVDGGVFTVVLFYAG